MQSTLHDRLLRRELGNTSIYSAVNGIYGDKSWIDDLDIVNELGGHSGCVNALRQVTRPCPLRYRKHEVLTHVQLVDKWKASGFRQR